MALSSCCPVRDDVERRLARWYERIESDDGLEDAAADRIRELKARQTELVNSLKKASAPCVVPPYLYTRDTIERFRSKLRETFTNGDRGVARVYLRQLVERIVVGPEEIVVEAKAAEVIAMMAGPGSTGLAAQSGAGKRLEPVSVEERRSYGRPGLARQAGVEPATYGSGGRRSIQLSFWRVPKNGTGSYHDAEGFEGRPPLSVVLQRF